MILSAAANVTMGDNKMKQTNKQNNPFDASSRRSVADRGGGNLNGFWGELQGDWSAKMKWENVMVPGSYADT